MSPTDDVRPPRPVPPGWYRDPHVRQMRWWDGQKWTTTTAPIAPQPHDVPPRFHSDPAVHGPAPQAPVHSALPAHHSRLRRYRPRQVAQVNAWSPISLPPVCWCCF
ncbi:DUF2510 domain-containing protein [Rhodococcus sp. NCIMB 12038]|uniref:DUF2510 domain-containing protein n=1 Tax=Rhodococcus sp. NCIMB 12038 TaxID=933800 RepID=UPI000B3C2413|nr:hypothetical protein CA951_03050 [Rhodococcus sp. NCIMB 12038]